MRATVVIVAIGVMMISGCSGSGDDAVTSTDPATPTTGAIGSGTTSATTDATAPPTTVSTSAPTGTPTSSITEVSAAANPTTSAPSTVPTTVPAPAPVFDLGAVIEPTTPATGNPARPMLRWDPVDGAEQYTVVVTDSTGATWWAWSGPDTAVVLGGVADGRDGPTAGVGVTWIVLAHDGAGVMVAAGERRPLEP